MEQAQAKQNAVTFQLRDCALLTLATGVRAISLRELGEGLRLVDSGSIYHHFWGRLLQTQFDEPEYNNDFAAWAYWGLNDKTTAERLSMIDPTEFQDIDMLRRTLIDTIEMRLDESDQHFWATADSQFYFLQSKIVVLPADRIVQVPGELSAILPSLSAGSIYYHFIDARRRTPENLDDFSTWLIKFGGEYQPLIQQLKRIDPFFSSLQHIRDMLTAVFSEFFAGELR